MAFLFSILSDIPESKYDEVYFGHFNNFGTFWLRHIENQYVLEMTHDFGRRLSVGLISGYLLPLNSVDKRFLKQGTF